MPFYSFLIWKSGYFAEQPRQLRYGDTWGFVHLNYVNLPGSSRFNLMEPVLRLL